MTKRRRINPMDRIPTVTVMFHRDRPATYSHRQAILDDPRMGRHYDTQERVYSHHHRYRETITLARWA